MCSTPIRLERSRINDIKSIRSFTRRTKRKVKRKFRRINIDEFTENYRGVLGIYLTELCRIKMTSSKMRKMRYTNFQKWLAVNVMIGCSGHGYSFLSKILSLPSLSTISRYLQNITSQPGITHRNAKTIKLKVNPASPEDTMCFILLDEMSLRRGLQFNERTGSISGFCDDGIVRNSKLASSVLCIMVVGIIKKWKYPLGFFLTDKVTPSSFVKDIVQSATNLLETEGFQVMGFTTDQGSNFQRAFRELGAKPESPAIKLNNSEYFVHKDPPHLLKSARNMLEIGKVHVPGHSGTANWQHIEQLYQMDCKNSLRLCPKLTRRHIYGLKFANRMKVKLAAQVLSNSTNAAFLYAKAYNLLDPSVLSTASFCKNMNDIFDALNSLSSRDSVPLRRPLHLESPTVEFLEASLEWLRKLQRNNSSRRCKFIIGLIQSINVALQLNKKLSDLGFPFLSCRNLCQDPLELFFCKVRFISKNPTCHDFAVAYGKICTASLVKAPRSGNCEVQPDHLNATIGFISSVSLC